MRWACALSLFLNLLHLLTSLKIAAFNIKSFGVTKAQNSAVMGHIREIVWRYDIILIQEVRDTYGEAINTLMNVVNSAPPSTYSYISSDPLGATSYKERYVFLYRDQIVSVANFYTYDNTKKDFSRQPFVVRFSSKAVDFVLIPQHTCPRKAVDEVDALFDVVADVRTRWGANQNIMLLGDFNAGCTYIKDSDWQRIRLFTDKTFHWLIGDNVDTTVSGSNCPYDRIVVTNDLMNKVVPNSAEVYNYKTVLNLNQREALDVSDHFPVEVELTG
ncbi:deoxyribonuclease-1-like isoform X2 [Anabas testudineus]|uniref:deoxyribonuclease-1-like isoform X2 n=1 Tax=Anabas testudineus TaxID=64144 RepID=UPI000E463D5C|nr:deoxyribonuclease-1-like isoform X2 [Anabas testudineus]